MGRPFMWPHPRFRSDRLETLPFGHQACSNIWIPHCPGLAARDSRVPPALKLTAPGRSEEIMLGVEKSGFC